jgi:DNA-binding MarR family transcriptional regulator
MDREAEFVSALKDWTEVFMKRSVGGFIQFAKEQGMSMSQIGALFHISRQGGSGVSELGGDLGVTSAAASQILDRLVDAGLVVRREDPEDRRAKRIELTELGQRVMHDSLEARQRWYGLLAERLTARERDHATTALRTLIARSCALDAEEAPSRRHGKEHADQ